MDKQKQKWEAIKCPQCGSQKIGHFHDFKGKNAKIECGNKDCKHIWWTDLK